MISNTRVLVEDDGSLTDVSFDVTNLNQDTVTLPNVSSEDAIFVGRTLPWNHLYFDVATANDQASIMTVQAWNGREWVSVVNLLDGTNDGTGLFEKSGISFWINDKREVWQKEDTDAISDLSSVTIYGMYWLKITFSADINASTSIRYIGQKFSRDSDLELMYPELLLAGSLAAFKSGKTSWDDQHILAAQIISEDLKNTFDVYVNSSQVLDWEQFRVASTHLVASMAFRAYGDDFKDNFNQAIKDYKIAFEKAKPKFDLNKNARIDDGERLGQAGVFRR